MHVINRGNAHATSIIVEFCKRIWHCEKARWKNWIFENLKEEKINLLGDHHTIVLATSKDDEVTAKTVSYSTEGLDFYILSWDQRARKSRDGKSADPVRIGCNVYRRVLVGPVGFSPPLGVSSS